MSNKIIISAETGSDITEELAEDLGIVLIPMHVSMGGETLDDGTFPPEDICAHYDRTGKIPTTSGSITRCASVRRKAFLTGQIPKTTLDSRMDTKMTTKRKLVPHLG